MVMELRVIFETKRAIINVYNAYYQRKLEILKIQRQIFLNFKFSIVWKRRAKKWGGGIEDIY